MSKLLHKVRTGTIKFPKTIAGADYQYRILIRAYMRAYDGGGGLWDSRTLAINESELSAYLTRLSNFEDELQEIK